MPPKVSILLPVYNAETSLKRAVESILSQSLKAFELLLINDGSTDASPEIMQTLALKDERIRTLHHDKNKGIAASLNLGLAVAQAPYIARMDADDYSYPQRLERQFAYLESHPDIGLVSCLVVHEGDSREQEGYANHVKWLNLQRSSEQLSLNRFTDAPVAHPSVMFRKIWVKKAGAYSLDPGPEDYELWLRWMDAGLKMAKVPEELLIWQDLPNRLSRHHSHYHPDAFARVKALYLSRWLARNNPHHPALVIWGGGRKTRSRANLLLEKGCHINYYLDFKNSPAHAPVPVVDFRDHERYQHAFVVSYVNNRGARKEIRDYLIKLGKKEGQDFLIA